MRKIFLIISFCVSLFFPKVERSFYNEIELSFVDSIQIELIRDGDSEIYKKGTMKYGVILHEFMSMLKGSYQMPALGVSIDDLTRKEKNNGIWLEFKFNGVNYNSDLPFDSLLVKIERDNYGFNIIRKYENKYDGRCFYISLNGNNMDNLYKYLINI